MLRMKACCLVPMLMIVRFSMALPQGEPQDFYLDDFSSFATVGQVFAGPFLTGSAVTSLQVTNRDDVECEAGILFHQGAGFFVPARFPFINGVQGPFASATIASGGVMRFDVTADEFLQGPVALGFRTLAPGCDANSFKVTATYFLVSENLEFAAPLTDGALAGELQGIGEPRGDLSEAFSVAVNNADTWLCSGFCRAVSTTQGVGTASVRQRIAMAVSSVVPGEAAPEGSQLRFFAFDAEGSRIGTGTRPVDGSHTAFFPRIVQDVKGGVTIVVCLESSSPDYKMDLTLIRVNQVGIGTVQYDQLIFTDGFESGDLSAAWDTGN